MQGINNFSPERNERALSLAFGDEIGELRELLEEGPISNQDEILIACAHPGVIEAVKLMIELGATKLQEAKDIALWDQNPELANIIERYIQERVE